MKPKSYVWNNFTTLDDSETKTNRVKCNYCNKNMISNCTRMTQYSQTCLKTIHSTADLSEENVNVSDKRSRSTFSQSTILSYATSISKDKMDIMHNLLARAIHINAVPFSFFDKPEWEDFFHSLNPSFKLPAKEIIGSKLLNTCYLDIHNEIFEKLHESCAIVISTDGWTDVNSTSVFNIMACNPLPYFIFSHYPDDSKEKSENLRDSILKARETIISRFSVSDNSTILWGVVTDNPNVMRKARRLLMETFPSLVAYGCCAHALNNFSKDMMAHIPSVKLCFAKSIRLVAYFNQKHRARAFLSGIQKEKYGKV